MYQYTDIPSPKRTGKKKDLQSKKEINEQVYPFPKTHL